MVRPDGFNPLRIGELPTTSVQHTDITTFVHGSIYKFSQIIDLPKHEMVLRKSAGAFFERLCPLGRNTRASWRNPTFYKELRPGPVLDANPLLIGEVFLISVSPWALAF